MANIKSAKKRVQVAKVRNERNKAAKSEVKTMIKKVEAAVAANDKAAAEAASTSTYYTSSISTMDESNLSSTSL